MSKTRKILATLTMVAIATTASLTVVSSAQAHPTFFPHTHHNHHRSGLNRGEAAALGAVGGLLVGTMIANSNNRRQVQQVQPAGRSPAHVNFCVNRYRSYDVYSDTFLGFDGRRHYCNSPYAY